MGFPFHCLINKRSFSSYLFWLSAKLVSYPGAISDAKPLDCSPRGAAETPLWKMMRLRRPPAPQSVRGARRGKNPTAQTFV